MRKHFLILMLFALLPLAGWAQQELDFGTVQISGYTYGGANLPVPLVKDAQNSPLTQDTHYTVSENAYAEAACQNVVAKQNMEGGKSYYLKITGIGAFAGKSTVAQFTVSKKALSVTVTTNFSRLRFAEVEPTITEDDWSVTGFAYGEAKTVLGTLAYTYAGKGDKNYPGGEYAITFSGLSSKYYDIKYPTNMKFTIVGKDLTNETVTIKDGTNFADKTYKGDFYTAADLTGLKLIWDTQELVQGTDFDVVLNAIYSFTSYPTKTSTTSYGTGKVNVLSKDATDAIVVVTENSVNGFVGKKYKVALTANNGTRTQLFGDGTGNDYTTASGIWVEVTRSTTDGEIAMNVGDYNYGIKFKGNYSGSKAAGVITGASFTIVPAPISVMLKAPIEVTYDNTNKKNVDLYATGICNYAGFVGEDIKNAATIKAAFDVASAPGNQQNPNPNELVVKTSSDATNVGNYTVTISGGSVGAYTNYTIANYVPGTLKINPIELTIKANPVNKALGAEDPTFTLDETQYTVAANTNDVVKGVTFTRVAGETAGLFAITPDVSAAKVYRNYGTQYQSDVTANYTFKIAEEKANLTIGKATVYVTINDAEKFYGEEDPEFTASVVGLVGDDELPAYTITRTAGENVNSYGMTATIANPDPAKYNDLIVTPGIFTIKKAQLTFTMPTQNVVTGDKANALKKDNIVVAGIKNSDVAANLYDLAFNFTTPSNYLDNNNAIKDGVNETVATGYKATLKTAAANNYEIVITPATATTQAVVDNLITGKLIINNGTAAAITFDLSDANPTAQPAVPGDYAKIVAAAGETQSVTINFSKRNRKINNETTDIHTWAADNWNALILPFDITVAELSHTLGFAGNNGYNYCVVNTVKKNSAEGKFQFELVTGTIPANTPFMVKTIGKITTAITAEQATITGQIDFGNKKIVAPAANSVAIELDNGYKFVGQYASKVLDKNMPMNAKNEGLYRFQFGDDDAQFRTFGPTSANSWTVVPFDCYIDLSADAASAREVIFEFEEADGTITAIKSIAAEADKACANKEGWYTINGVKLQNAPAQKGIYIFNGKKLVVK